MPSLLRIPWISRGWTPAYTHIETFAVDRISLAANTIDLRVYITILLLEPTVNSTHSLPGSSPG